MKPDNLIKTSILVFVAAFLLSSCGKTVMTIKAPSSPEIEAELTMILENIILDDSDPSISYKKGFYQLKLKRDLAAWERMALRDIVDTAVRAEGFEEIPGLLKLKIREKDPDIIELLNLEEDQVFECPFYQSKLAMVKGRYGEQEVYELGAVVYLEEELPELEYEMGVNSALDGELGDAMQSLLETMQSFGPMSAEYELYVSDGQREMPVNGSLEHMNHAEFLSAGVIQTVLANPYGLSGGVDFQEGLEDFFRESGFSEAFVSGLLFPALSRDAEGFDFPEKKS